MREKKGDSEEIFLCLGVLVDFRVILEEYTMKLSTLRDLKCIFM